MHIQDLRRFRLNKKPCHVDAAIRTLVKSSYRSVPCFRERLDEAGIIPDAVRSREDLSQFSPITRENLPLEHPSTYLRCGTFVDRCYTSSTSGTSGTRLTVIMSKSEAFYRKLLLLRAIYKNTRRRAPLTIVEVGTGEVGIEKRRKLHWGDPIRVIRIPRSLPILEQRRLLLLTRPTILTGHPSCMELVAEGLDERPSGFAPELVVSRGEILYANTRDLLERVFRCRVADYYSCDEVGNIAWECPVERDKLHVNTDGCFVEVVDELGHRVPDGQEGSIVVTNLFNLTMPFIRYELGDRVTIRPGEDKRCSCGYVGQSLHLAFGRLDDYVWLPDGRRISPQVVSTAMGKAAGTSNSQGSLIRQYQVIQESIDTIRVRAVKVENAPDDIDGRIARAIEELVDGITCEVEWVESLPVDRSGKRRKIVSNVRKTFS